MSGLGAADAVVIALEGLASDDAPDMSVASRRAAAVNDALRSITSGGMTETDGMRALLGVLSDAAHDATRSNVCDESGNKRLIAFAHGLDLALEAIRN